MEVCMNSYGIKKLFVVMISFIVMGSLVFQVTAQKRKSDELQRETARQKLTHAGDRTVVLQPVVPPVSPVPVGETADDTATGTKDTKVIEARSAFSTDATPAPAPAGVPDVTNLSSPAASAPDTKRVSVPTATGAPASSTVTYVRKLGDRVSQEDLDTYKDNVVHSALALEHGEIVGICRPTKPDEFIYAKVMDTADPSCKNFLISQEAQETISSRDLVYGVKMYRFENIPAKKVTKSGSVSAAVKVIAGSESAGPAGLVSAAPKVVSLSSAPAPGAAAPAAPKTVVSSGELSRVVPDTVTKRKRADTGDTHDDVEGRESKRLCSDKSVTRTRCNLDTLPNAIFFHIIFLHKYLPKKIEKKIEIDTPGAGNDSKRLSAPATAENAEGDVQLLPLTVVLLGLHDMANLSATCKHFDNVLKSGPRGDARWSLIDSYKKKSPVDIPGLMRIPNAQGCTPIASGWRDQNLYMVESLTARGASLREPITDGKSIVTVPLKTVIKKPGSKPESIEAKKRLVNQVFNAFGSDEKAFVMALKEDKNAAWWFMLCDNEALVDELKRTWNRCVDAGLSDIDILTMVFVKDKGNRSPFSLLGKHKKSAMFEFVFDSIKKNLAFIDPRLSDLVFPISYVAFAHGNKEIYEHLYNFLSKNFEAAVCIDYNNSMLRNSIALRFPLGVDTALDFGADIQRSPDGTYYPLASAVSKGDFSLYQKLIMLGATIDITLGDDDDDDLVYNTAFGGNVEIMKHLLARFGDKAILAANKANKHGCTPLGEAISKGHEKMVECLITEAKIAVNAPCNAAGDSPVMDAAKLGKFSVCKKMIDLGADVTVRDTNGDSLIDILVLSGNVEIMKHLLARLGDDTKKAVNEPNKNGFTPLGLAIFFNHEAMVEYLITEAGVNVDAPCTADGCTPVLYAAEKGNFPVYQKLIGLGANTAVRDSCDRGLVHCAAQGGNVEIMKDVLAGFDDEKKAAVVDEPDENQDRPLYFAISSESTEMIKYLIEEAGVDLNDSLILAVRDRKLEVYKKLIELGADFREIKLHDAAYVGNVEIMKDLLERLGSDAKIAVNKLNEKGEPPLYFAVKGGAVSMIEFLVSQGADVKGIVHGKSLLTHVRDWLREVRTNASSELPVGEADYETVVYVLETLGA